MANSQKKLEKNLKNIQDIVNYKFSKKGEKTALVNKENSVNMKNWQTKTDEEYRKILAEKKMRREANENMSRTKSANIYSRIQNNKEFESNEARLLTTVNRFKLTRIL